MDIRISGHPKMSKCETDGVLGASKGRRLAVVGLVAVAVAVAVAVTQDGK